MGWVNSILRPVMSYSCSPHSSVCTDLDLGRCWGGVLGASISAFWREDSICFFFPLERSKQNVSVALKGSMSNRLMGSGGR